MVNGQPTTPELEHRLQLAGPHLGRIQEAKPSGVEMFLEPGSAGSSMFILVRNPKQATDERGGMPYVWGSKPDIPVFFPTHRQIF